MMACFRHATLAFDTAGQGPRNEQVSCGAPSLRDPDDILLPAPQGRGGRRLEMAADTVRPPRRQGATAAPSPFGLPSVEGLPQKHCGSGRVELLTRLFLSAAAVLTGMTLSRHAQDAAIKVELAPTGTLRVGLIEAPSAGLIFVSRAADGKPAGVTADLSTDLARTVGLPLAVTLFPNSGAAASALQAEAIDVSFMPVDATRRQVIDFGPGYYDLESTYLASGASGITDVAQVDRPGIRVLAIHGTTTFRASARTLKQTQPIAVPSVAEAVERMRAGQADAFALSRDTLRPVVSDVPGSRIVSGGFQQTQVAVAVPKGRPGALASVATWLEGAKRTGTVRRIFDAHGFCGDAVAP